MDNGGIVVPFQMKARVFYNFWSIQNFFRANPATCSTGKASCFSLGKVASAWLCPLISIQHDSAHSSPFSMTLPTHLHSAWLCPLISIQHDSAHSSLFTMTLPTHLHSAWLCPLISIQHDSAHSSPFSMTLPTHLHSAWLCPLISIQHYSAHSSLFSMILPTHLHSALGWTDEYSCISTGTCSCVQQFSL